MGAANLRYGIVPRLLLEGVRFLPKPVGQDAPFRSVGMFQRMVLPSGVALPCTWDSEDAMTSAIDVLTDLDADGLVRPDESAGIPGLVLVSQVDAFRFFVMLQKSSLIDRVLGFVGGHIRSFHFRFFLCTPRSRRPAATSEDADELLHGVSPKRQVSLSLSSPLETQWRSCGQFAFQANAPHAREALVTIGSAIIMLAVAAGIERLRSSYFALFGCSSEPPERRCTANKRSLVPAMRNKGSSFCGGAAGD
ncbi:MAG: hypothetical protein IJV49_03420 [Aeriscardovia sp.]|nr:hypothetical protein [Aeriscardovia sp.]